MTTAAMPRVRVGCSGWHYQDWRGRFYPSALPASEWLAWYARRFDCVELNNSFYRLPARAAFARWRAMVPARFTFAVKASRYLTHVRRLREPRPALRRLFQQARGLGAGLGPILYQLPPRWMPDPDRLAAFLEALPPALVIGGRRRRLHHVLEFRDPRGYAPDVVRLLARHRVSLCVHDMEGLASPRLITGGLAYVRLHGYGARYGGSYPAAVLRDWAGWLRGVSARRPAFVFFNNDVHGHAVANAGTLAALLRGERPRPRQPDAFTSPTDGGLHDAPNDSAAHDDRLPAVRPAPRARRLAADAVPRGVVRR